MTDKPIKPKLAWGGENWMTTFVRLNDAKQDRRLEVKLPDGQILGIEFGLCGESRSFLGVTLTFGRKSSPHPLKRKKRAD